MIPHTPSFLIAAAASFVGLGEDGADNHGQMVELFLREVRQPPGEPWCAAFVHHVGYWSHFDHQIGKSSWPLPATASCYDLGDFARQHKLIRTEPRAGDVFLLYFKELRRFAHTGIVVSVDSCISSDDDAAFVCTTIEGNTNADGTRNGRLTLRKTRRFSIRNGDRYIRWAETNINAEAA